MYFQTAQPTRKNQYSWERRLSVYWAYLRVINVFHAQYSDTTNINHSEADALETVNEANRQLLCIVREYREMTNPNQKNKTIDAAHMERKIRFFIQDAAEIKIHIWYVMCRLECFLTNMRKHLHQLLDKSKRPRKPVNVMNCKACPYCVKSDEREQSEPAKNRKHRKQQRQQQQPKQNNRTEHGGQQKQKSKQQQQQQRPSRQPKGRKGTSRTPSNRGRKC
uniref:Uncharacterized protein n=1 Tax=Anopheles stephensi TaxID=30069 RepID=A0A182XXW6_ANOST